MTSVVDKIRKAKLRWFGLVKRRYADALVMRYAELDIAGTRRSRGRPETYWKEVISQENIQLRSNEDMTYIGGYEDHIIQSTYRGLS